MATTRYFDTNKRQGKTAFPEIAVKQIPDNAIFACIPFFRVFHGTTNEAGLTVLPDARALRRELQRAECRAYVQDGAAGDAMWALIRSTYEEAVGAVNRHFNRMWTPDGSRDGTSLTDKNGHPMTIVSIFDKDRTQVWP